jgi:hypothetical protein
MKTLTKDQIMDTIGKCITLSCLGVTGIVGLLFIKVAWRRRHGNLFAKAGKGLDNKLKESIVALDEAKARVQSAFDHLRDLKS